MATYVRQGESIDSALSRFKREVARAGIISEMKKRDYYVPPSEKRRIKSAEARKRLKNKISK
jgi:small subunit ribosomal protein S21